MVSPIAAVGRTRRGDMVARFGAVALSALALAGCLGYDGEIQHGYQLDPAVVAGEMVASIDTLTMEHTSLWLDRHGKVSDYAW